MSLSRRLLVTITLLVTSLIGVGSPVASAAPAAPSHQHALTRADVPWKSVGPGWAAINVEKDDAVHLLLISPAGQNYDIAVIPAGNAVRSISRDGQYVLVGNDKDGAVWNMRTGKPVAAPTAQLNGSTYEIAFSGHRLVGIDITDTTKLITTNLAGRTLARSESFGEPIQRLIVSNRGLLAAALTSNTTFETIDTLTLHRLKRYTTPWSTILHRFTDATHFQYAVKLPLPFGVNHEQVYRQSIFSDTPEQLTTGTYPGGTQSGHELGFEQAWDTPVGLLATGNIFPRPIHIKLFKIVNRKYAETLTPPGEAPFITQVSGQTVYTRRDRYTDRPGNAFYAWNLLDGSHKAVAGPGSPFGGRLVPTFPWSRFVMIE